MKDSLVKNIHLIIILYAGFNLFTLYEDQEMQLENTQNAFEGEKNSLRISKRKIKEIKKFRQNLANSKERVKEVVKQIEKVQRQLPTDVNDAEVQQLLGDVAKRLKIKDPSPAPGKEFLNGFYYSKEYNFRGQGTFLQLLIFFENLAKMERILNVKQVSLTQAPDLARSRFQVLNIDAKVESFRYNQNHKEKLVVK